MSSKQKAVAYKVFYMCNANLKMKALFLGTGAADWHINSTIKRSDGEFRRNTSILINDSVLVDCGPDVLDAMNEFSVNPGLISDIFITHSHKDHFDVESLKNVRLMQAKDAIVNIWADKHVLSQIEGVEGFVFNEAIVGVTIKIAGLDVTPLSANHPVNHSKECPLHYIFVSKESQLLYAIDGAWLPSDTWYRLRDFRFDSIIWDATVGFVSGDWRIYEHNSIEMVRLMLKSFSEQDMLSADCKIILSHFSKELCPKHDDMQKMLAHDNIIVSFDGMRFMI